MARFHRSLVHHILTVAGLVTLTGLLSRRPPVWLWGLRSLPLAAFLLVALGAVNLLASSPSQQRVVYGFAVYGFFIQTAVILVVFFFRRSDLDMLDRQLEKLGKIASCNSPALHRQILTRIGLFVSLSLVSCGLWVGFPLADGEFVHGNYQIQMEFPKALQTRNGYWYCIGFQIVVVMLSCCLSLAFDCCFFTWLNAVAFHLAAIQQRVESLSPLQSVGDVSDDEGAPPSQLPVKKHEETVWTLDSAQEVEVEQRARPHQSRVQPEEFAGLSDGKVANEGGKVPDVSEVASTLKIVDQHYSQVTALVRNINHLCGLPVLVTHASAMTTILFGLYACISLGFESPFPGRGTQITGFVVFIFIFILRIIFVSFDSGQITERGEALAASLADMEWLHLPQEAKERREALMQKTSQPPRIDAAGVFYINKINVLNIFSFVLTYLVIMIQLPSSS